MLCWVSGGRELQLPTIMVRVHIMWVWCNLHFCFLNLHVCFGGRGILGYWVSGLSYNINDFGSWLKGLVIVNQGGL